MPNPTPGPWAKFWRGDRSTRGLNGPNTPPLSPPIRHLYQWTAHLYHYQGGHKGAMEKHAHPQQKLEFTTRALRARTTTAHRSRKWKHEHRSPRDGGTTVTLVMRAQDFAFNRNLFVRNCRLYIGGGHRHRF